MKRKIVVAGLCLFVVLSAGWVLLLAAKQRSQKTRTAPALRVEPAKESDATGKTVAAAKAFLATLDEAGRAKVSQPFDDEHKTRWSNFPVGMVPRNGARLGDLSGAQREAALKLLATALSRSGLQKVKEIMEGDEVLKTSEGGGGVPAGVPPGGAPPGGRRPGGVPPGGRGGGMGSPNFGRDNYYLAFLGAPSLTEPWMIQFGGHHLAINVTVVGKSNVMTPSLPAAQPAIYKLKGETVRPLGRENDKSFALVNSLDAAQQKLAILNYQVSDLVLGPGEDGKTIQPEGIKASSLNAAQQQMLLDLAHEWVGILNDEAAAAKMAEIKANLPETWFAWSGTKTNGSAAYFRIQGPTLLIEYSPQRVRGSGGLDTNHIHTIYRDPTNDYGEGLVKR
ncbi:MAG TPA: DUF3500 domain-containing protein [Pyrinomonadaceae bacterium]|nr:DUF3500 domain-containing protein [Pyrinomonadaceae bacterium]